MSTGPETIAQAFRNSGIGRTISCDEALSLAVRYGLSKREIREYCDVHGIRIHGSQTSCFR